MGAFLDGFAMFGFIICDGQWWNLAVPLNQDAPNPMAVGYNLLDGGGWHYTDTAIEVNPDTWYEFEMKLIAPGRAAWLRIDGVLDANGPFGPGTDPSTTRGTSPGIIQIQPKASDLGGIHGRNVYYDDWQLGGGDWISDSGGSVCFADDFETVPSPDSFVPPWDSELIFSLVPPFDRLAEHAADPADPSNTVADFYGASSYMNKLCVFAAVPGVQMKYRGGVIV